MESKNKNTNASQLVGLKKFTKEYNDSFEDLEKLKKHVSKTLDHYEHQMKLEKARAKAPREPDEDGWIEVRSKKRKDLTIVDAERKMDKKAKKDNLVNFYSFEIRENKLKRLQELRDKFEEDKKRLALMRSTRKFVYK